MSKKDMSRRAFLGSAAVAAGAAALSVAGFADGSASDSVSGSVATSGSAASTATSVTTTGEYDGGEYDVIVVGAGLAGLASAITVATEGDGATCLLLEKGDTASGNSPYCAGSMLYCTDADAFYVYLDAMIGDSTPDDVKHAFADELTHNLDWLKELGCQDDWIDVGAPDDSKLGEWPELENDNTYGRIKFKKDNTNAPVHVYNFLEGVMEEHQDVITYMTNTAMESLIQDPSNGMITGVVAGGKSYKANRGVVMCCGGFESDESMLYNYTGVKGVKPYAGAMNTGDGHRACMKAGADFWHMYGGAQYWEALRNLDNTEFVSVVWNFTTKQYGITVGTNGRRFYMDYDACSCPTDPYAEADSDIRLNVGFRHGITQFGGNWTHLPMPDTAWFIFDADALTAGAFPADKSADPVADGWAYTADTIDDLAAQIDVPADELDATVAQWNAFCDDGKDAAFYRPADTLTKVATAPFYAVRCAPAMLNTDGGPVRDAKGEILDPTGAPIPHLYSAGEFGSVWGHLYQGTGNVGECAAFGRISARSALANV